MLTIAAAESLREALQGPSDYFKTLDLPEALVHWGHPGNMAVVLLAMGGYGALTLGWQIRTIPGQFAATRRGGQMFTADKMVGWLRA